MTVYGLEFQHFYTHILSTPDSHLLRQACCLPLKPDLLLGFLFAIKNPFQVGY